MRYYKNVAKTEPMLDQVYPILLIERKSKYQNFLNQLDKDEQLLVSAILGAIISASHNRSLVILDSPAITAIASYAAQLVPECASFLLPIDPNLYKLGVKIPGITACLGMRLVYAAVHVLNTMKTFAETKVAVANDGPGAGRQQ